LRVGHCLAEAFEQMLVEGLAAGQAGQRVGLAVIEQIDVVAKITTVRLNECPNCQTPLLTRLSE